MNRPPRAAKPPVGGRFIASIADNEIYRPKPVIVVDRHVPRHVILSVAKNLRHRRANRWGTEILRYAQNDMKHNTGFGRKGSLSAPVG